MLENAQIGIGVLALSAAIDAYSLNVAYVALSENAKSRNMTLTEFVNSGHDPTSVAVVAEDAAAVAGCGVAAAALLAAHYTGNNAYDALGSVAVGGLLGLTATYLINSNRLLLLGRSLGDEKMKRVVDAIRADPVVTEVYVPRVSQIRHTYVCRLSTRNYARNAVRNTDPILFPKKLPCEIRRTGAWVVPVRRGDRVQRREGRGAVFTRRRRGEAETTARAVPFSRGVSKQQRPGRMGE